MTFLAETNAALDATAKLEHAEGRVADVLSGYGLTLSEVAEWSDPAAAGIIEVLGLDPVVMPDQLFMAFDGRFVGAIAAAIILGIELERHKEVVTDGREAG